MWNQLREIRRQRNKELPYERGQGAERVASASESYLTVGESSRIEWRSRKVVLEAEGGRKMYKMSTHLLPRETRY